jgi:energy-converting hydrogenase Eha subunit G
MNTAPLNTVAFERNRLSALALSTVLTLAMLMGVNALATADTSAPQLAQAHSAHA